MRQTLQTRPSESQENDAAAQLIHGVTFRSVAIGLVSVAVIAFITPYSDLLIRGTWMACSHLPMAPLLMFAGLILFVNTVVRHVSSPKRCLTHSELFVIYILMLVGAMLPSFGITAYLIPTLAGANYFATPENHWAATFYRFIKPWFVPFDPHAGPKQEAMRQFYEGLYPEQAIPWTVWVRPLVAWTIFAAALFFVWFCLATILRKQWVDREKLTFPLVQLPVEMAKSDDRPWAGSPFFTNRLMWFGFAVPFVIHSVNSLHLYFPGFPMFTLQYPLNQYFTTRPWNAMGPFTVWVHFSVVGFSFLLPTDLSFSLWFSFLFFKGQEVFMAMQGRDPRYMPNYPVQDFAAYQMLGGFIVFFAYMLFLSRGQFRDVFRRAVSGAEDVDDRGEPMSYRTAFFGLILGTLFLAGWSSLAGLNFWIALLSLLLFYMIAITLTRFVAEGGLLFIQAPFRPSDLMASVVGTHAIGAANLTVLSFIERIFIFDLRGFMMPSLTDSFKIADSARLKRRQLAVALIFSILIAVVVSYVTVIWIAYRKGGGVNLSQWFLIGSPTGQFNWLQDTITSPKPPDWSGAGFTGLGALVTLFLSYMRVRFTGWPFHPLGYAMGPSWPMIQLWFSIMIGWWMKSVILRYGGMKMFVKARPAFLGMVLGEFAAAGLWLMVDAFTGIKDHRIFLA